MYHIDDSCLMDVVEVINEDVTRVLSGLKGEVVHIDS